MTLSTLSQSSVATDDVDEDGLSANDVDEQSSSQTQQVDGSLSLKC